VVVTGRPGTFDPHWLVTLSAVEKDSSTVILKQEKHVGVLSPQGSYHCGFWLAEVGCEALTLTATIAGSSAVQRATIPFRQAAALGGRGLLLVRSLLALAFVVVCARGRK